MYSLNGGNGIDRGNEGDFEVLCGDIGETLLSFPEEKKQNQGNKPIFK